jgi:hypothetical protein
MNAQSEKPFTVALLQFESIDPIKPVISHEIGCDNGSAIIAAVIDLCELIRFDPNDFDVDIEQLLDTSGFTDNNFVLLEPFGGGGEHVLADLIIAKTAAFRAQFPGGKYVNDAPIRENGQPMCAACQTPNA